MKGVKNFIGEFLSRPFTITWAAITGVASLLTWYGIDQNWSSGTKVFVGIVLPLTALLIYTFWMAYSFYTASTEASRPLRVRNVKPGTHYFEGESIIILERHGTVSIGDLLTLFVREGDMETPICLLSVETFTTEGFPQSMIFHPLTNQPLTSYLNDESRHEQLQAKPGVTRSHLEGV